MATNEQGATTAPESDGSTPEPESSSAKKHEHEGAPPTGDRGDGAPDGGAGTPDPEGETPNATTDDPEGEGTTFDREYVQQLRSEAAGHRRRATEAEQAVEDLRRKLWSHEVAALGLLADPEDLPYDSEAAGDPEAVKAAAEALIARKPHMARTSTSGPLPDAADREPSPGGVSWSAMLRGGA